MKRKLMSMALVVALSLSIAMVPKVDLFAADEQAVQQNTEKIRTKSEEVNGIEFSLTIDLTKWDGRAGTSTIDELEKLFFEAYPAMYDRFGFYSMAPTDVTLVIRDDSELNIAGAAHQTSTILINQNYLAANPQHYDAFTHELAHLIQNGWKSEYIEYDKYKEIFANYCRYIYAYKNGKYNDASWTLNTAKDDKSRENSSRFLVWLDMETSSSDRDIIRDYFEIIIDKKYPSSDWGEAWKYLFKGTKFAGKSIDDVWKKYEESDFGGYPAKVSNIGETSELIKKTDARNYIKKHSFSESYEAKLKGITLTVPNAKKEEPSVNNQDDTAAKESVRSAAYEFGKNIKDGRYVFNTRIMENNNQSENKEAFYNLCDALINGKDTFKCSNENAFKLVTDSDILGCYFPFAADKIKGVSFEDGVGKIEYLIPKDEFVSKEKDYEKQIEDIINSKAKPGEMAFKNAISLFNYCRDNYSDEFELNRNYSFLLLQCGIPAHLDMNADNKVVTVLNLSGMDYTYDPNSGEFKMFTK
ncbi:hypothetical protein D6853_03665 [Butyrivibrio sp. X503]|uniref:hypothetical protein n=1 Tax=Butyrivibrio sp. X503 TaxID=2364878 RepID=UPI000EA9E0B2|nr:hypothetical protein [Butyrivibrio sp. X503]RKM57126.1 hypothetical protein D6853_03665 [Butyrivibrio sp. X503]